MFCSLVRPNIKSFLKERIDLKCLYMFKSIVPVELLNQKTLDSQKERVRWHYTMNKQFLVLFLFLIPVISSSQELYFPPAEPNAWQTLSPTSLGYCPSGIDSLYTYLDQNNTKAFILLKDGKIVLEKYFGTFAQDSLWYWASAGKTLIGFLVGVAQQENHLSIDDATSDYLGQGWTSCTRQQEQKITIRNLLSMTSGLNDGVANPECTDASCLQFLADAGTRWAYHNGAFTILGRVIDSATGRNLNQFMFSRLKNLIGMDGGFTISPDNLAYFSTPRSMARFGLLLLAEGMWESTPVLSNHTYYQAMTNSSQSLNPSYGYLIWLNGKSYYLTPLRQTIFPGSFNAEAPDDMFAALGKNGQLINLAPSQGLVWIRMGDPPTSGSGLVTHDFNNEIWIRVNGLNCIPTSVEEQENVEASAIMIYPNPATDKISIQPPKDERLKSIEMFDVAGKSVLKAGDMEQISLTHLRQGVYLLEVKTEQRSMVKRLVIH